MAGQDQEGQGSKAGRPEPAEGQEAASNAHNSEVGDEELGAFPPQSPFFHAEHSERYGRQALIRLYQREFECRLAVLVDNIFEYGIVLFEDLIYDADPEQDLHILLSSPGGDGETAVRLVRSAQARCRELTVIVPDQAKSAATLLALGAHHILMGPTSDLGPVDPQLQRSDGSIISAKDIISAVLEAEERVEEAPATYPLYAALLEEITAVLLQRAHSALGRTDDLMREALKASGTRSDHEVERLAHALSTKLVLEPQTHEALFGIEDAEAAGLPVVRAHPSSVQWRTIWRLYTKYYAAGLRGYEGERASKLATWATTTS